MRARVSRGVLGICRSPLRVAMGGDVQLFVGVKEVRFAVHIDDQGPGISGSADAIDRLDKKFIAVLTDM